MSGAHGERPKLYELSRLAGSVTSEGLGRPYGRHDELTQVCRLDAGVILIAGDGGVGKSELLRAVGAQLKGDTSVLCSGDPLRLPHRPGALQQTLFQALGEVVSHHGERTALVERWSDVVSRAAGKVAQARLQGLVAGAGRLLLGVVRARAGDEVADLAADFVSAVSEADAERLEARIAAQADSDVLEVFCAIAQEVCDLIELPVVLLLDGAERLDEDDFRLLLDLAEQMPTGLHLVVTHTAAMPGQVERIQRLDRIEVGTSGIRHVPLRPLDEVDVDAWVTTEQIDVEVDVAELTRVTGGYPLHIDAALAALARGESLSTLSGGRAFVSAMRTNVAALEPRTQELVARLAGHTDRPEEEQLLALVDMGPEEWAANERYLEQTRILVTSVDGRPWFHELGRRAIWFEVLSEDQRELSARRSLGLLTTADAEDLTLQNRVDVVELVRADRDFAAAQPGVTEVLSLNGDELAVLAALVELDEPTSTNWLNLDAVVRHARHRFGAGADLVPVAHRLAERGLLLVEETRDYAIVLSNWESAAAYFAAVGRMAIELPRVPVGALATRVFDAALRGPLGGFAFAECGIGMLGATELSARLKDAEHVRDGDVVQRQRRPGIILRSRLGELGMYAAVSFESQQGRDEALAVVRAAGGGEAFGEPLVVELLEAWPGPTLAPFRIASAVELVTGQDFRKGRSGDSGLPAPATVREQLELHARLAGVVRQLSSPLERDAMRFSRSLGFAYAEVDDRYLLRADIEGRGTVVEIDVRPDLGSAHLFSDLESHLDLGPLESLSAVHWGGRDLKHPLPALVAETVKRLKAFNAQQRDPSMAIALDGPALSNALQEALDRRTSDAQSFVDAGALPAHDGTLGRSHYVLLTPDSAYPGRLRRPNGFGYVLTVEDPDQPTVVVRRLNLDETKAFLAAPGAWFEVDSYRPWFDLPATVEAPAFRQSDAADAVARLLDHETVRLVSG